MAAQFVNRRSLRSKSRVLTWNNITLRVLLCVLLNTRIVTSDFACLCCYSVQLPVYKDADISSDVIGHLYEFDCKALYNDSPGTSRNVSDDFTRIQIEHQVGYVHNEGANVIRSSCAGNQDPLDAVVSNSTSTSQIPSSWPTITPPTRQQSTITSSTRYMTSKTTPLTSAPTTEVTSTTSKRPTTTSPSTTKLATTPTAAPRVLVPDCDDGWTYHEGACYYFNMHSRKEWDDAKDYCSSLRSHLVIIETSSENKFLAQQLDHLLGFGSHEHSDVWTAGTDDDHEGDWRWDHSHYNDESSIDNQHFQNWGHHEPDTDEKGRHQDCLCLKSDDDDDGAYQWHDTECDDDLLFVCEKPGSLKPSVITTPIPTTTTAATTTPTTTAKPAQTTVAPLDDVCPTGWSKYQTSCYFFSTNRTDWSSANAYCYGLNSHLVSIEDMPEEQYLHSQLNRRINIQVESKEETGVWTGGIDSIMEGMWEWTDLISHNYNPVATQQYANWYPGQPGDGDGGVSEDCLSMLGADGFQWHDSPCSTHMYYICELPIHSDSGIIVG